MCGPTPESGESAEALGCFPFVVATIAAATAAAMLPWAYGIAPFAFVGALVVGAFHVSILALPIYFTLAQRYRPRLWTILAGAVLIGAIPSSIVAILAGTGANLPYIGATCGFCGLCGGSAFWLTLRLSRQ
jgi:hypothetical protein